MILAGCILRVGAKPGKMKHQSHQIGIPKVRVLLRLISGGEPLAVAGMENLELLRGTIRGLRNLNLGVGIETTLGMEKGVGLRLGIHMLPKGPLKRKNGSRKVHWEHLSGKETTKSERIYRARESQTHRI